LTDRRPQVIAGPVLALIGPTAIGKTSLSLSISKRFNCEIVSVDSMQVYRYMDIGTAKATAAERRQARHHLLDIVDPDDAYNAARFVGDCLAAIDDIHRRGAIPLLTGGTGLYLAALKKGLFESPPADSAIREQLRADCREKGADTLYEKLRASDPESAGRIHPNDTTRIIRALEVYLASGVTMTEHRKRQQSQTKHPEFSSFCTIGLTCDRDLLYKRIGQRTEQLFELGLENEVRDLLGRGYRPDLASMQSIGYRHMLNYISGDWDLSQCVEQLARDTRHYAKRQFTWFNRDETIAWFDRSEPEKVMLSISEFLYGAGHHKQEFPGS